MFADLTFEFLPVVGGNILAVVFDMPLCFNPILEALEVNKPDRASALAS